MELRWFLKLPAAVALLATSGGGWNRVDSPSLAAANRIEILAGASNAFAPVTVACWAGDQLSWRNDTNVDHDLGVLNSDGRFVSFFARPLRPGTVSSVFSPALEVGKDNDAISYSIPYVCRLHPHERGVIHVTPTP